MTTDEEQLFLSIQLQTLQGKPLIFYNCVTKANTKNCLLPFMLIVSGKKVADVILKMELISRASLFITGRLSLYFHSSDG